MKKLINLLLVLTPMIAISQTLTQNFIKTSTYKVASPTRIVAPTIAQVNQNVTYFDGLGRPIQQIQFQQSPSGYDIVTPIEYDAFGRQVKDYLPYASAQNTSSYLDPATLVTNLINQYKTNYGILNTNPFSQKAFEASPLNRVLEQAAPGNDWALASTHTIKLDYQSNTVSDQVKLFNARKELTTGFNKLTIDNNTYYAANQLYKTITKDENWTSGKNNTTEEFKNKEGQVILKRTYSNYENQTPILYEVAHDTYYVYDIYGNLTYVLPPLVNQSNFITTTSVVTDTPNGSTTTYQNVTTCIATYDNFSKIMDRSVFTGTSVSGGGFINVSIVNNVLSVTGTAGFGATTLSNAPQTLATTLNGITKLLPNLSLGSVNSNGYTASITNGQFVLSGYNTTTALGINYTYTLPQTCSTVSVPVTINTYFQEFLADQTILDDVGYQYKYDSRNRLIEKKLPGKQWEFIVYDKLDRVVATGPALSPFSDLTSVGWMVTKYDAFSRPVLTAWYPTTVTSTTRTNLQNSQNGYTTNFNETKTDTNQPPVNGVVFRYTTLAWPQSGYHVLTVNYYDDYNYPNAPTIATTVEGEPVYYNNTTVKPKGLSTGTWTRVLQTSSTYANELSYTFYDKKARPIRTHSTNFLGGYTYTDSKLDFTGKPEYIITHHKRLSEAEIKTKDAFTYSPQGRLLTQTHQIGTGTVELIASNTYDELGQLVSKKVGNNATTPTQKVDYTYNIRGWLTGINNINELQEVLTPAVPKDLFAFKISYNDIADVSKKLYNGNISQTFWKTANTDTSLRDYVYTYDALNRLKNATDNSGKLNETIYYDKNGNITNLTRLGEVVGGTTVPDINNASHFGVMDNLKYTYDAGNRLQIVSDSANDTYGFKDDYTGSGDDPSIDYTYDANGNMLKDLNKGIGTSTTDGITYNHLNLPTTITFGTAGNIVYIYNALGQKVQKVFNKTGQSAVTTDYLGGYQYNNAVLKFFPTAEGYVEPSGSSYKYVYQYKDHLGNVRLSYDKSLVIQEENNYYPFGLKQKGYNTGTPSTNDALKYKYNGKELQDELGLNFYDYGARNYDAAIGRWMNVDPLAEMAPDKTPYHFVSNNPINRVDPRGLTDYRVNGETTTIDDGHKGVLLDVSQKQLNRLQSKFDKGSKGYERMMNRLSSQNGYTTYGATDEGLSITKHKAGGDSYQQHQDKIFGNYSDFKDRRPASGAITSMEFSSPLFPTAWAGKLLSTVGGVAGRVFWSGGGVAKNAAAEFAAANGMKTLEMTTAGSFMNTISPYLPRAVTNPIWDNLSANFAKGAAGEVNLFTTAVGPRATSIWLNVEKPILESNGVNIITNTVK